MPYRLVTGGVKTRKIPNEFTIGSAVGQCTSEVWLFKRFDNTNEHHMHIVCWLVATHQTVSLQKPITYWTSAALLVDVYSIGWVVGANLLSICSSNHRTEMDLVNVRRTLQSIEHCFILHIESERTICVCEYILKDNGFGGAKLEPMLLVYWHYERINESIWIELGSYKPPACVSVGFQLASSEYLFRTMLNVSKLVGNFRQPTFWVIGAFIQFH